MRNFIFFALILAPLTATASTWGSLPSDTLETPITAEERVLFEKALKCEKAFKEGHTQYYEPGSYASFEVKPDGTIVRLWNAAAERSYLDNCQNTIQ